MPESEPIPRRPWEDLSFALTSTDMKGEYPEVELHDGTPGVYIGAQDVSAPDAVSLESYLLERFGDNLEMAGCTVKVDKNGEVAGYGKKPGIISYAVRRDPRPRPTIVKPDESLVQRLKGKPIVRWLFRG